jgi:hypothetical protein
VERRVGGDVGGRRRQRLGLSDGPPTAPETEAERQSGGSAKGRAAMAGLQAPEVGD